MKSDVDPSQSGPNDVNHVVAIVDDEVLDKLEELHKRKPVKTRRNSDFSPTLAIPNSFAGHDPGPEDRAEDREEKSHFLVKAHLSSALEVVREYLFD